MSNWLRMVLAVVVAAHGIGHILFLMPLISSTNWGQVSQSWLLGGGGLARGVGAVIWLVSLVGFVAAAFGIFRETDWWQTVAVVSAAVSTVGLVLFWTRPSTSPALSALIFNLLVLAALLIFHWPLAAQTS
ncbi:MAG: hypothetical protein KF770_29125 [Anaerolineae bacterium]|nr:hypothetical protein [Anaerolineae bacterium]